MSNTGPNYDIDQLQRALEKKVIERLIKYTTNRTDYRPVIMPECGNFFLSQIDKDNYESNSPPILEIFDEYFARYITMPSEFPRYKKFAHRFYWGLTNPEEKLAKFLLNSCSDDIEFDPEESREKPHLPEGEFYPDHTTVNKDPYKDTQLNITDEQVAELNCCIPCGCMFLWGNRRLKSFLYEAVDNGSQNPIPANYNIDTDNRLNKLFVGDTMWLYFFERMGIFKIIGGILDDYANNGKYPIPSNDFTSLIIEMMIREIKKGTASTIKDRAYTYARTLGWKLTTQVTEIDRDKVMVNNGFTKLFHKFITSALYFYKEKRLAEAIKGVQVTPPSTATVITIQDTISLLKNSLESFRQGRNYYNTLNGIIWVIAGLDLIYRTRDNFGIPLSYQSLEQLIPAAYNIIVEKKSINSADPNRYKLHYECAQDARDVLIDIDALPYQEPQAVFSFSNFDQLRLWLNIIEPRIEGYRGAYMALTGIDLAKEGYLNIEQEI
ncbi:MAG TPA: hypothetical protein VLA74_09780 [Nitrososphaeraceae archaeon]|nr:hypothetical protein [Nitrososphaeraceae archaeon]